MQDALCLVLRNIADDVAIEVHLVAKPTYKRQLVKKAQIKAWLTFLVKDPLYLTAKEDNLKHEL